MALRGPESCYVELQQGGTTIAATLSWRPLVLTIDNQPSGGAFRNGKAATVRVGNFPANDRVTIQICANGNQGFECEYKEEGRTDSAGSVTFERYDLNCGQINIEGQCELVAIDTSPRWSDVAQANYFITYGL
jgi:hypothetical protein